MMSASRPARDFADRHGGQSHEQFPAGGENARGNPPTPARQLGAGNQQQPRQQDRQDELQQSEPEPGYQPDHPGPDRRENLAVAGDGAFQIGAGHGPEIMTLRPDQGQRFQPRRRRRQTQLAGMDPRHQPLHGFDQIAGQRGSDLSVVGLYRVIELLQHTAAEVHIQRRAGIEKPFLGFEYAVDVCGLHIYHSLTMR